MRILIGFEREHLRADHMSLVEIFAQPRGGATTAIMVETSWIVGDVKEAIEATSGIGPRSQRLVFNERVMRDHRVRRCARVNLGIGGG